MLASRFLMAPRAHALAHYRGRSNTHGGIAPTIPSRRPSKRGTAWSAGGNRPADPARAVYSLRHGALDGTASHVCSRSSGGERAFDSSRDAVTSTRHGHD